MARRDTLISRIAMLRATAIVRQPAVKADRTVDVVSLAHASRGLRRVALKGESGLDILVDLDKDTVLNDGDALKLEDGRLVRVQAAPESLLEVRAENPLRLLKAAFHLASRHAAAEITADALFVEDDPAVAELVRGQGCTVAPVTRPFHPERSVSAHACEHDHAHHHGHAHGHDHHHHDHGHAPGHGHSHHDRDNHDHGRGHSHHRGGKHEA